MSSTAIVLPMLAERDLLTTPAGRDAFAVLLFQDLAFIPLVAIVPLLSDNSLPDHVPWRDVARAAFAVAVILIGGRFLLRPLFRAIGGTKTPEVFTTVALLLVTGTALIATEAGLSPSLGAFMAGVLLSESEYRHELQADIEPFEGLLLGFFFMSVGMSADLDLARTQPALLAEATAALLVAKVGDRLRSQPHRWPVRDQRAALRIGLAASQRVQFRAVRCGGCRRRALATARRAGHAGDRRIDGCDADTVRRLRSGAAAQAQHRRPYTTRSTPRPRRSSSAASAGSARSSVACCA